MKMILFDYNQFTLNKTELEKHASKTLIRFNNRIKNYILDLDFLYVPNIRLFYLRKTIIEFTVKSEQIFEIQHYS